MIAGNLFATPRSGDGELDRKITMLSGGLESRVDGADWGLGFGSAAGAATDFERKSRIAATGATRGRDPAGGRLGLSRRGETGKDDGTTPAGIYIKISKKRAGNG